MYIIRGDWTMQEGIKFSSFTGYKKTVFEITDDLKKLRVFSHKMKLDGNVSAIDDVLKRLTEDTFNIAIVGEFNRGKSTLINALLGKDVLPMNVLPTTATLNKVSYSVTPFVKIEYKENGGSEEIAIDQLNNYVTKLTKESEEKAKTVKEAVVYYPVNYCKDGVTIIDTPGLNDGEAMDEVTMSVLPQVDAALMVIMAQAPFSASERDFLESKIITSDLGRVLFVVTGIDLIDDEDDVKNILENIAGRIQENVITKARNTYGGDSKEFETYKRKIGKVRVYGLSAKKALKAKLKDDNSMLEESRFPVFETELERFLSEDRGAVMLSVPVNRIKTSSLELEKAIQLHNSVLAMQKEEFNEKYKQAMAEIEKIRNERQGEFTRINESAQDTYSELIPAINNYWPLIEAAAENAVDSAEITLDELKGPALDTTQKNLTDAVKNAISKESQILAERIQANIETAIEKEAERVSDFEAAFYETTSKIQNLFVKGNAAGINAGGTKDMVISTITSATLGLGLGSVYLGFRQAGWKGALLGGATGIAGFIGVGLLASALLPVAWPALIIASLAGTLMSKFALNKVFRGDKEKIEKFKNSFKDNVLKELANIKTESNIGDSIRSQIVSAFDALKNKIKTETENILTDTQNQLTQLKVELAQTDISSEKEKGELEEMLKTVDGICARADETGKQLAAVLSR
jgi:predicted GTPase